MYNTLIASEDGLVPVRTPDEIREEIANDLTRDPSAWRAVILRDGDIFGYIRSYGFNMSSPKKRVIMEFDALADPFDDDLIELIRDTALKLMQLRDTTRLLYKTPDKKIHDAFERLNGVVTGEVIYFRLDLAKANVDFMEAAMERAGKLPGYSLRFYDQIPDELVDEYAERFTGFLADMPDYEEASVIDPVDFRRRQKNDPNTRPNRYLLFDDSGKIVGHTNVMVDLRNPGYAFQHITGVVPEHRGKGLGLWMKSAMYFRLREDFPQLKYVMTDTLKSNVWMQQINADMGFEVWKEAKEYKLVRENLEALALA
ncbi:MAG TPA: GNAT family N-acetyltransferase [Candidatus Kapabacteria bacterium]|nr:GNAT family N-acetyltransferase [Candidatus Kapabacteria bacterium]